MKRTIRNSILALAGALIISSAASAAPLSRSDDGISEDFEFIIAPYLMFANLSGEFSVGQIGAPVDISFGDIVDNLDFAFAMNAEARKGRWGVVLDGQYMKLGVESEVETPGPILSPIVDASIKFFVMNSVVTWRQPINNGWIDLFAGIRYTDFKNTLSFMPGGPLNPGLELENSIHPTWVSPIFGFRAAVDITDVWYIITRADIGGFGAGSSLTYSFNAGIGFNISRSFDITLTFRYLADDYKEGTEGMADFFEWDMKTYGGQLGLVFHW